MSEHIQATRDIVDGNLRYTSSGYWAEYLVVPHQYGSRSAADKRRVGRDHEQLFKVLIPLNPILCGTLAPETQQSITAKSYQGLSVRAVPEYAQIHRERLQELADDPFHWPKHRVLRLAVPVGRTRELAQRNRAKLLDQIPRSWRLIPAQPQDMEWLWTSATNRGVLLMPRPEQPSNIVDFTPALFDDGAKEDAIDGFSRHKRPAVLKITPEAAPPSYQALLKVNFPKGEMLFPGGTEIFHVLNHCGLHVDWAVRCHHYPRRQVKTDNDAVAKIIDSNRYETALDTKIVDDNDMADDLLTHYSAKIAQTGSDSTKFITILSLGAQSYEALERGVTFLSEVFANMKITFERIAGLQQDLWAAMLPGTPNTEVVRSLCDETTITEFAELVPFITSSIGTPTGPIFGRCIDSGLSDLFRLDLRALLAANKPSNIALAGGLGSGKSSFMKLIAETHAALGDPQWSYDRTEAGEWATFYQQIPGHIIVDLLNPQRSICALKTFQHNPRLASRHALSTLVPLLKFEIGSEEALALSEALIPDNITAEKLTSMPRLADYLLRTAGASAEADAARRVGRHLKSWCSYDFARALFDEDLDPINYDAPAICLRTYGLPSATPEKLYKEHLFKRLRPEELYVESVYELTGLAMRENYFSSPRHCLINIDEAYHMTSKPVGREMLDITAHDSRKHGVTMVLASHLGKTDYDLEALKLIGIFLVGRTEHNGAADNLLWGGMHPEDNPHFLSNITENFSAGDFYVRFFDQIGHVKMFQATSARMRAAANTTFTVEQAAV
ncbi:AAA-like domain protein (plasmid) [Mycobacterium sp. THAF192]|nr:AAA-like domain protein [Mycobacterium sp. THAF192]